MKTNKKAILGFAASMIFSLALMQGINQNSIQQKDQNIQQVSGACAWAAGQAESDSWTNVWTAGSLMTGSFASGAGVVALTNAWNPGGWTLGGVVIGSAL